MHGLQRFVLTHSEESDSLLFILFVNNKFLLTSAFLKENSAITIEECVLMFKVFTTATRKLEVKSPTF